ncbi:unnamed protein product [Phaedon cochleariae]|uniref:PAS domain-containing protein n=1 Tax=Phaedon cochleariae TaxID=80249 RepID=A0A9N9WYC7_PHACE|nr:unnamed protein product [Phaedon cochleariae]
MPVRRGLIAPRTTLIETIIKKFDTDNRSFLVANSREGQCHIIYCSDGFCRLTGYSRADVMQRHASCEFLCGPLTSQQAVASLRDALHDAVEKHAEILYYRKDVGRARASFRQSLRFGSNIRGRGLRLAGYLTPPSDVTAAEEEEDRLEQCLRARVGAMPAPGPALSPHARSAACACARVHSADDLAQCPRQPPGVVREGHHISQTSVSHATSLDAIARRQCFKSGFPTVSLSNKPQLSKQFHNVSSESDLQRFRTAQQSNDRRSPSLSNQTDSMKQKFSFQDNGSAKFFQSGIHTPKMGEKVAQSNMNHINPENINIIKKIIEDFENTDTAKTKHKHKRSKTKKISSSDSFIHKYKKSQISPKTTYSLDEKKNKTKPSESLEDFLKNENDVYINFFEHCDIENADANAIWKFKNKQSVLENSISAKSEGCVDEFRNLQDSRILRERVNRNVKEVNIRDQITLYPSGDARFAPIFIPSRSRAGHRRQSEFDSSDGSRIPCPPRCCQKGPTV